MHVIKTSDSDQMETKVGEHYWGLMQGELLAVLRTKDKFEVAGPWECGVSLDEVEIISHIPRPAAHADAKLYYGD